MDPQRGPASAVNPDAGAHKVTANPIELEAARRAADETWNAFPYFEARYGDRGKRFGVSDAGWLVTLCDRTPTEACEQVKWLAVVLASRGMPSITLEHHLQALHAQLHEAVPQRRKAYEVLRSCADELRRQRRSRMADAQSRVVARMMPQEPLAGIGELLVSAVVDEANGIARAVSSIEEWLCGAERFTAGWIDSVQQTIAAARAALSDPPARKARSRRR